ncbi:MAG: hypothetical protein WCO00_10480, partial [Rhodospirillaceae bacterium]
VAPTQISQKGHQFLSFHHNPRPVGGANAGRISVLQRRWRGVEGHGENLRIGTQSLASSGKPWQH